MLIAHLSYQNSLSSITRAHNTGQSKHTIVDKCGFLAKVILQYMCNGYAYCLGPAGWLCVFTQICIGDHCGQYNAYEVTTMWSKEGGIYHGPRYNIC